MGGLARAWLDLDIAVRAYTARAGTSPHARALTAALTRFNRAAAGLALSQTTTTAKEDFTTIVRLARAAGLSWQNMAEAVNQAAEHNPRG